MKLFANRREFEALKKASEIDVKFKALAESYNKEKKQERLIAALVATFILFIIVFCVLPARGQSLECPRVMNDYYQWVPSQVEISFKEKTIEVELIVGVKMVIEFDNKLEASSQYTWTYLDEPRVVATKDLRIVTILGKNYQCQIQ